MQASNLLNENIIVWQNRLLEGNGLCCKSAVVQQIHSTDSATYTGEEQSPQGGVDDVQDLVANKYAEDGEKEEHDEAHEEHTSAGSEVILALEGVQREVRLCT